MSIDLTPLDNIHRLLFEIPLVPVQGRRFQPTGFPGLGAATFQTPEGASLLVESAQSMGNRFELACWDETKQDLKPELTGLSHVRVTRKGEFLTDTILEAHRINSPYLLVNSNNAFVNELKDALGVLETGPIDRRKQAKVLLWFDIGSLLHCFLTYFTVSEREDIIDYLVKNSQYTLSKIIVHNMPDEGDVPFLEIALSEGIPLVTGNLKHYPESKRRGCQVLTPRQFIDKYSDMAVVVPG